MQKCADKLFALDPESPHDHFLAGLVHYKKGDIQEAVRSLKRALKIDPYEHEIAHIEGAFLVDQSLIHEIIQNWPRETPIVAHCHHGIRSLDAAAYLAGHGFTNVKSMTGGMDAWSVWIGSCFFERVLDVVGCCPEKGGRKVVEDARGDGE